MFGDMLLFGVAPAVEELIDEIKVMAAGGDAESFCLIEEVVAAFDGDDGAAGLDADALVLEARAALIRSIMLRAVRILGAEAAG